MNGRLEVEGGSFQEARLEAVNGAVRFDGDLPTGATLDVETVNGAVFTIASFGGEIDSDFELRLGGGVELSAGRAERPGSTRARGRRERHEDGHRGSELRFTTGRGGAKVTITTLNGAVALRKR